MDSVAENTLQESLSPLPESVTKIRVPDKAACVQQVFKKVNGEVKMTRPKTKPASQSITYRTGPKRLIQKQFRVDNGKALAVQPEALKKGVGKWSDEMQKVINQSKELQKH